MKCKIKYLCLVGMSIFLTPVFALDSNLDVLKNNKESVSTLVSNSKRSEMLDKYSEETIDKIVNMFKFSLGNLFEDLRITEKEICDSNYINYIAKVFSHKSEKFGLKMEELEDVFYLLRIKNQIDDVFLQILLDLADDYKALLKARNETNAPWFKSRYSNIQVINEIDYDLIFEPFLNWENNKESCMYDVIKDLEQRINKALPENLEVSNEILKKTFLEAYSQGVITLPSYKTLEYIRKKSNYIHANPSLKEYFEIIFRVKDKMTSSSYGQEEVPIENEDSFTSKQLKRLSTLTHRKKLYKKYNSTQIFMLAQVLEKASIRMGNDPDVIASLPVITQSFSALNGEGERTNYVETFELDTNSQYQYARKRLRMDIIDLQNMRTFSRVRIEYTDIITAALETGYITHEDIQTVVKYDDLWNKEIPPFYRLKNFAYMLGRSSLLYLPAPWNITASIGLTAVESLLNRNQVIGENNDNPATLFN